MGSSTVAMHIGEAECALKNAEKALDSAFKELKNTDALMGELRALRAFRDGVQDVSSQMRAWASSPVGGMGSGLHCEMHPFLNPEARKRLIALADLLDRT